ncbi:MAG: MTAP family purine nucleoside phosphorylase, partial [Anaerolineae bacterium]|nr:MTAP family purine nucleoside phosphorylase [Anaerolineae bacterium]
MYALIVGTGADAEKLIPDARPLTADTPYGAASGPILRGEMGGRELLLLGRHGPQHLIPPHRINYRANIFALREAGASSILSWAAVGGIGEEMTLGAIAVPHQIIDYTHSRQGTIHDGEHGVPDYVDFTEPYTESL